MLRHSASWRQLGLVETYASGMGWRSPLSFDLSFDGGKLVFLILLFAVLNLSVGFAAAVLLGYGPQPWYALFLPSRGDNVIQIDAIDSDDEAETPQPQAEAEPETPEPAKPAEEPAPDVVNQPFPEMNEPEDTPIAAEPEPEIEEPIDEPVAEQAPEEPVSEAPTDEDNELEEYLAGRKDEPAAIEQEEPATEEAAEIASADDIASMFAASEEASSEEASSEEARSEKAAAEDNDLDDKPLAQDDIAALFNS